MRIQLSYYHPKVVTSEVENDAALAAAEELARRPSNSPEENVLLELLVMLIEASAFAECGAGVACSRCGGDCGDRQGLF
jgi:hypothetical protein